MTGHDSGIPLLIYDGDCRFCRIWVDYWRRLTGDMVSYAPYQQVADLFPQIPVQEFERAVQLMLPDGQVFSGADAVVRVLAVVSRHSWLLRVYLGFPGLPILCQWVYRSVVANRSLLYYPTVALYGRNPNPPEYGLVCSLFLRLLGVIYLIAFLSFGSQVHGLIGSEGVLPVSDFLTRVHNILGSDGYRMAPTVFWINSSDHALTAAVASGCVCAVLLMLGLVQRIVLVALFVLYLSLVVAGQVFMGFQWDILLVEVGFLAIFLTLPGPAVVFLFRALLFRLVFLSGTVKLLSGDTTWRGLTSLNFHYETQPLPTWTSWYMHQLPEWFQNASVAGMLYTELAVPFLIFAPRRLRFVGAACLAGLNLVIFLTGNFTFFNLLAIALCLFLLDDALIERWMPERIVRYLAPGPGLQGWPHLRNSVLALLAAFVLFLGVFQMVRTFAGGVPRGAAEVMAWTAPFRLVNPYGLFANMTTSRYEIAIQGSNDGQDWKDYRFKYKPDDPRHRPRWVAPHQPRLDWQMWFVALGRYDQSPWLGRFVVQLLRGSPPVLDLLAGNPFPDKPPRYIRADLYRYNFTDFDARNSDGTWWRREYITPYLLPTSLENERP